TTSAACASTLRTATRAAKRRTPRPTSRHCRYRCRHSGPARRDQSPGECGWYGGTAQPPSEREVVHHQRVINRSHVTFGAGRQSPRRASVPSAPNPIPGGEGTPLINRRGPTSASSEDRITAL